MWDVFDYRNGEPFLSIPSERLAQWLSAAARKATGNLFIDYARHGEGWVR